MIDRTEAEIMQNWDSANESKVSICCISYNHEPYIRDALNGFLMQSTNFSFEILVDDDCSKDHTQDIIREYQEKYPNIIKPLLRNKNVGAMTNFTENIKRANRKYIAICEGDDYWTDASKIQKQVDFLEVNHEYVMSYHNINTVDKNNTIINKNIIEEGKDYNENEMLSGNNFIPTCTRLFRNVELDFSEMFNGMQGGDVLMAHLLGFHGKTKFQEEIENTHYRQHSGGIWSGLDTLGQIENYINNRQHLKRHLIMKKEELAILKVTNTINSQSNTYLLEALREKKIIKYFNFVIYLIQNEKYNSFVIASQHIKSLLLIMQKKLFRPMQ